MRNNDTEMLQFEHEYMHVSEKKTFFHIFCLPQVDVLYSIIRYIYLLFKAVNVKIEKNNPAAYHSMLRGLLA